MSATASHETYACTNAWNSGRQSWQSFASTLPSNLVHDLGRHFPPARARYVAAVLSLDELKVICDIRDALILARIKRMRPNRLKRFDRFVPSNSAEQKAYRNAQMDWIRSEHYLLGTRLGRSPTDAELFADFMGNRNGLRFRAFYALKFPKRMTQIGRC